MSNSPPSTSGDSVSPPSMRRRLLAIVAFGTLVLSVVLVGVFMLQSPVLLLGGLFGLAVAVAGGWLLVTEQYPRLAVGIVGIVVGVVIIGASVIKLYTDSTAGLWRTLLLLVLLAVTVETARAALAKDLHELDRLRSQRARPVHPVLTRSPVAARSRSSG